MDGGKGSNQALAVAALGAHVAFVGRVGDDELGKNLVGLMHARGVDVRHLSTSSTEPTGYGINILDDRGVPEMIVIPGANDELGPGDIDAAFSTYRRPKVVLTQMEVPPLAALYAAKEGRRHGAISIVNAAPPTAWPLSSDESVGVVDILVVNETEAEALDAQYDGASTGGPDDLPQRLAAITKCDTVIVTLGERGLHAFERGESWRLDAAEVPVTDTSGAGDAFCAALAVAVAEGVDLRRACAWASAAAAVSVTRSGTIPSFPSRDMVDGFAAVSALSG
jgi:ribokinase